MSQLCLTLEQRVAFVETRSRRTDCDTSKAAAKAAVTRKADQTTMQDKLLELLKSQWVTPIDALNMAGCFSLSQRCGGFKRAGYPVKDKWVDLANGKRVKAYTLAGRVEEGEAA